MSGRNVIPWFALENDFKNYFLSEHRKCGFHLYFIPSVDILYSYPSPSPWLTPAPPYRFPYLLAFFLSFYGPLGFSCLCSSCLCFPQSVLITGSTVAQDGLKLTEQPRLTLSSFVSLPLQSWIMSPTYSCTPCIPVFLPSTPQQRQAGGSIQENCSPRKCSGGRMAVHAQLKNCSAWGHFFLSRKDDRHIQ